MKRDTVSKKTCYIAVIFLFVVLLVIDIIRFRVKKGEESIEERSNVEQQELTQERSSESSIYYEEGEDDDYLYQEGKDITTEEMLTPEYEEYYENFSTENR